MLPALVLLGATALDTGSRIARRTLALAPYALVLAVWAALKLHAVGSLRPREVMLDDPTLVSWAATLGAVALRYVGILFLPLDLAVNRAYRVGVGVHYRFDAPAAVGFAIVAIVVVCFAVSLRRARRDGEPALLAYGIGWALVAMAPYAHAVPFGALMAERFLHTALFGFAWALVALLAALRPARLLLVATVLAWSARSAVRSADWRDPIAIWAPVAAAHPDDPLAHFALGEVYLSSGRTAEARVELERALALNPHSGAGRNMLGMALLREGNLLGADAQFEAALLEPDDNANAMNGRGAVAAREGRLITARTWFTNALAADPRHQQATENLRDTDTTIARAAAVRDAQREAITDPVLLRQACVALEDPECIGRVDASVGSPEP